MTVDNMDNFIAMSLSLIARVVRVQIIETIIIGMSNFP